MAKGDSGGGLLPPNIQQLMQRTQRRPQPGGRPGWANGIGASMGQGNNQIGAMQRSPSFPGNTGMPPATTSPIGPSFPPPQMLRPEAKPIELGATTSPVDTEMWSTGLRPKMNPVNPTFNPGGSMGRVSQPMPGGMPEMATNLGGAMGGAQQNAMAPNPEVLRKLLATMGLFGR